MGWNSSPKLTGQEATVQEEVIDRFIPWNYSPYLLKRKLGGPRSPYGMFWGKRNPLVPGEIRTPDRPACS